MSKRENQLANLDLAEEFWLTEVPQNMVIRKLDDWGDCGSAACFGGWLAKAGMFGLEHVRYSYYPMIDRELSIGDPNNIGGFDAAKFLFGKESLFGQVGSCSYDKDFTGSEYELVLHRIRRQRERLLGK